MFLKISLRILTVEVYNMMNTLVYKLPQLKLIFLSPILHAHSSQKKNYVKNTSKITNINLLVMCEKNSSLREG